MHPNLCSVLSPYPAGLDPAPEGETLALDFKALSERARFAVEVKDKPKNNSARKYSWGEATQSTRGGKEDWGLFLQLFLEKPCQLPTYHPGTLLLGHLRGVYGPPDPIPT